MRSSACDTFTRLCARRVLCWSAFPLASALGSTGSAADRSALFAGFAAVESGEVERTPCLCPLAQTAPAGFPPRAFPLRPPFPVRAPLRRRRRIDAGRKVDQPHKSELLHQPWKWILSPHRVSPFLGDERTEPTLNPAIHPMEQFSYVRLPVIVPPAAYDRVDRL